MLTLTTQLDRVEDTLPVIPARIVRLQRALAGATADQIGAAVQTLVGATRIIAGTAGLAGRVVAGQTRAASTDVLTNAQRNAKQVVGQAKAQGRRVSATAEREVADVLDAATDAVDDDRVTAGAAGPGKRYELWTKADLLERARELEIEGRHNLNKQQLIAALRNA